MVYKMHPDFSWANQEKKVINKILSEWYRLGYTYEAWFWLDKPWLQLNEK